MKRMDGYIRVSAVMGREGDSYMSPAIQEASIRQWLQAQGVVLGKLLTDEDVSGGRAVEDRGLAELLKRAEAGVTEGVVVYNLDRFGRDELDAAVAIKRLTEADARLISTSEGIDSSRDDEGTRMVIKLKLMFAEAYLNRVKGNWDSVKRRNVEVRGLHICGRAPFGYRRVDEVGDGPRDARLVVVPEDAETVRTIFEMRAAGHSFANIHRVIGTSRFKANVPTRVVKNRAYLGEARAVVKARDGRGKETIVNPDGHEAIVTPELFAAAQKEPRLPNDGTLAEKTVLSGIASCASCGKRMHVRGRGPKGARRSFYTCPNPGCEARASITADMLDEHVVWLLANDTSNAVSAAGSVEQRWLEARERVKRTESDLAEIVADRGGVSVEVWRGMIVTAEREVEAARADLYELPDPGVDGDVVWLDGRAMTYKVWNDMDREQQRRHLRRYIGSIKVKPVGRGRGRCSTSPGDRIEVRWIDGSEPVLPDQAAASAVSDGPGSRPS